MRRSQALQWLYAWQRIEKTIDDKWDPNEVRIVTVSPPVGTGLAAGVAPEAIKDPQLRAQYEADIEANRLKIAKATEQIRARNLQKYWVPMAKRFLIRSYMEAPDKTKELQTLLGQHVADAADREQILEAVKNKKMPEELVLKNTTQPAQ